MFKRGLAVCLLLLALGSANAAEIVLIGATEFSGGKMPVISKWGAFYLEFQGWRTTQRVSVTIERTCVYSGWEDRKVERMKFDPGPDGAFTISQRADDCRGSYIVRATQGSWVTGGRLRAQHAFEVR